MMPLVVVITAVLAFGGSYKLTELIVGTSKENEIKQCSQLKIEGAAPCEQLLTHEPRLGDSKKTAKDVSNESIQ